MAQVETQLNFMRVKSLLKGLPKTLAFLAILLVSSFQTSSAAVIDIVFKVRNPSCPGSSDGYIIFESFATAGATGPTYNFRFNPPTAPRFGISVGDTIFNLASGNYFIDVIDNGVYFRDDTSLVDNSPLSSFLLPTDPSCFGICDGEIEAFAFGGTGAKTFLWDDPPMSTTAKITGLCDGRYRVTITDASGCTFVDSADVVENSQIIPNVSTTNVACFGDLTGSATAAPTGGTGNFAANSYSWSSSGNTSDTENGLAAGTYTVTVEDSDGCTATQSFTITEPAAPLAVSLSRSDAFCFGTNTGSITTTVSGGTIPYTYLWNDGDLNQNRNNVFSGNYTVTVTDNNNCTETASVFVDQPADITTTTNSSDVLCNGGSDGFGSVTASGGVAGNKTFNWSTGQNVVDNTDPYSDTLKNLSIGKYYVTITNVAGCTKVDSIEIDEPTPLVPAFDVESSPSCNGGNDGTITASASGGITPYTFNWSNGVNNNPTISGLSSGSYTVTVIDGNGCTNTLTSVLVDPAPILPNLSATNALCFGECTGSATANPTGGNPPYTYGWSSGGSAQTENNLCAGPVTVTVTDAGSCTSTATINVGQPAAALAVSLNKSDAFCFGSSTGSITTTTSGGTPAYTYLWNDGNPNQNRNNIPAGTYTVVVEDANGCTTSQSVSVAEPNDITVSFDTDSVSCNGGIDGQIAVTASGGVPGIKTFNWSTGQNATDNTVPYTDTLKNLSIGKYYVTITNVAGCTKVDSAEVFEPDPLLVVFDNQTDPLCFGSSDGTIDITASGGTAPYTYSWSDINSSEDRTGLAAGNYSVTVEDSKGCTASIATSLNNPALLTASIDSTRDVSCFGVNDGFARAIGNGGTGIYTYSWSNGPGTRANSGLAPGTYTVTVEDANGCSATTSATINPQTAVVASISKTDASCNGVNDGTATASGSGGVAPYTYNWNPGGQTTAAITGLSAGTYTVTVEDANGCTDESSINIDQPLAISLSTSKNDLLCNGDNSGDATVTATGGTLPYTYTWLPGGGTTATISGLAANTYDVTVEDANGCTNSASVIVDEPTVLSATITSSNDPTCNGVNDGTAAVTAAGGTVVGQYTYLWAPGGETTSNISGKGAGTYTVTVTDDNGCTAVDQVTLVNPASIIITLDSIKNVSCFGGNDGLIRTTATGGTQPYTYTWNPAAMNNPNLSGLPAGTYDLTVTDDNNCFATQSFTISEPASALSASTATTDILCNGDDDGTAAITVNGGTSPYTYAWPGGLTGPSNINLDGGTYDVTITDDNGCTLIESFTINEPNALNVTVIGTNVSCNGANDGTASASAVGGTQPYTFNWTPTATGQNLSSLAPGVYTVTVTDANACTDSTSITIVQANSLRDTLLTKSNVSCFGANDGVLEIAGLGGTPGYTYNWSNGPTTSLNNNLGPGIYTLTISDAAGCSIIVSDSITEPALLSVNISVDKSPCFGDTDGILTANESGGTSPYTYAWTNTTQTTKTVTGLGPNFYSVTVTDNNGCIATDFVTLTPSTPIVVIGDTSTDVSCFGANDGSAIVIAGGGTGVLTFNWSDGGSGFARTGLSQGTYTVSIQDANSCEETRTITINEPPILDPVFAKVDEACGGAGTGSASSTPTGGNGGPYTFNWSTGFNNTGASSNVSNLVAGNYSLTVTDNATCDSIITFTINSGVTNFTYSDTLSDASCNGNCDGYIEILNFAGGTAPYTYNWSNGVTTAANPGLCPGNYDVTIEDANSCDTIASYVIAAPSNLVVNLTTTSDTCVQGVGTATINSVTGGVAPYTFTWSGGTGSGNTVTGLTAGNYDVTIEDQGTCITIESFTISNVSTFNIVPIVTNVSCKGLSDGSIFISTVGGVNPVTYNWAGTLVGANPTGLSIGFYDITVTDAAGCAEIATIEVTEPDTLEAFISTVDESCVPGNDGSASAFAVGGTAPYTFAWSGGTQSGNNTTNLSSGGYSLTVTDNNGCQYQESFTIFSIPPFNVNFTTTNASCNGGMDGEILVTLTGATPPITYNWSGGLTGSNPTGLAAGNYNVTITDASTCSRTALVSVIEDAPISSIITATDESCSPGMDAYAIAEPTGGVLPYTYTWSAGTPFNDSVADLSAGGYTVTIEDNVGCSEVKAFTVLSGSDIDPGDSIVDPLCFGECTGQIFLRPTGGTGTGYTYLWNDGLTSANRSNLCLGSYAVTISDDAVPPCTKVEVFSIVTPSRLQAGVFINPEDCNPGGNGGATLFISGGTGPYTVTASAGNVFGNNIANLASGTYTATITDANMCSTTRSFTVIPSPAPTLTISVVDATCNGGNDGSITVTSTGGANPLTYNWTGGLAGANPANVAAGKYYVSVIDNKGCIAVDSAIVGEGTQITSTLTTTGESCSPGNDGTVTANGTSGGVSPYTYNWGAGNTSSNTNTALTAGTYTVTVTDNIGCTEEIPYIINSDAPFTLSSQVFSVSCNGFGDGAINLTITGATGALNYTWDNGLPSQEDQSALSGGVYSVTITDLGSGCSETDQFTINEPDTIRIDHVTTPESCSPGLDGTITLSPVGGTTSTPGFYTYAWSSSLPPNSSQTGLNAGTYTVTVTDDNFCTNTKTITVSGSPAFTVDLDSSDVICNGSTDGTINLTTTATNPTFQWDNGLPPTQNQGNLGPGTYSVTVTDGSTGCTATENISINEPSLISATITTTDASCLSGSDGTASVTASGGTVSTPGIYIFSWSTGQSGANIFGLSPGNYDVTIIDDNGCDIVETFSIGSSAPYTVDLDSTDLLCNGSNDGTITLTTTAVNPSFTWSNGLPPTQNQSNLAAGTYTVTVSEPSSGCTETASITVNEPNLIVGTINTTPESCSPGLDGTASATAVGGTIAGSYTFNWSNGSSGPNISGLTAGSYDVTIIDDNNCSVVEPFIVGSDAPFNVSVDTINISCNGLVDGAIDLTVTGNLGTLSYQWDNSLPPQEDQNNLAAGTYNVTITDAGSGCTETASIPITEPSLIVPTVIAVDATCNVGNDGSASVTATGGTVSAGYTFNWSTGTSGNSINNLVGGNYDVTVTDDNGCTVVEAFTINSTANFSLDLDSIDVDCNGASTGSINLTTSAVNPSFAWSGGLPATQNQSNLAAGTYTVTVTEPGTGCTKTASIVVNQPSALNVLINKTNESCIPGGDGTASATVSGGTVSGNYTFNWSTGSTASSINSLPAGNYDLTVTDDNGCTAVNAFSINPASSILPNEVVVNESCSGLCDGRITLNPTGGNGNYNYLWDTGETSRVRNSLCGGTYTVTITDGSGCDTSISLTINSNSPLLVNINTTDQSCATLTVCDGSAVATVSGGASPYTYDWSAGINPIDPDTALSLCVGNYSITITDANGCSVVETFDINGPPPIVPNFSTTQPTCNLCNGSVSVAPTGGTSNFTFEWYDVGLNPLGNTSNTLSGICSGIYFVDITDDSGCSGRFSVGVSDIGAEAVNIQKTDVSCFGSCDGQAVADYVCLDPACTVEWFDASTGISLGITSDTAKNLCAGDYFVQVTNNSGCIAIEPVNISSPNPFTISSTIQNVTCFGGFDGQISVNVSGGSPAYTYSWSPGPLNGQGTSSISGITAGVYTLNLTDQNGCDTNLTFTVTEASEILASFTTIDANCGVADGFINATVTGGTVAGDFTYQWLDGSSNPIAGAINPSLSNVAAGTYFLRVIDDNACEKTFLTTLGNTNAPTIQVDSIRNLSCFGDNNGAIFITASGTNSPFTYNWIPQGQTSQDIANLSAGNYIVGVTNTLGCVSFDTASVLAPAELLANFTNTDASCGLCNGEARVLASGGTAPYTYLWSNGSTADTANALCAGVYSLVLSDANGCSKSFNFNINASGGPTGATVSTTAASCASSCDGSASVLPIGGTAPYTYSWLHNGANTNSLNNLCAGNYVLLITDRKGCSRNINVTITSPAALSMAQTVKAHTCNQIPCDGSIRLDVAGGTKPYTYAWSSSLPNNNVQNALCAGIYQVTVSDANGCNLRASISVPNSVDSVITSPSTTDVSCFGSCDGSLISNLSLSPDYNFQWFDDAGVAVSAINSDLLNAACAGDYFLEITQLQGGCKSYISATVDEPDSILLGSSVVKNISCAGECDGEIFISTTGGNILYSYSWNDPNNQDGVPATNLCAGTYSVTATDANGCSATTSVTLTDPPVLDININSSSNLICSSDCNGSASVSPSGGIAPYTFSWSGGQSGNNPTDLCFGPNLVTLTDASGCSVTDTVFISATDTVVAITPNAPLICGLDSIHLEGQIIGNTINSIAWYEGNTSNQISTSLDLKVFRPFGDYVFFLIVSNGSCSDTARYDVSVVPKPTVGLAPSVVIFRDEIAQILLSGKDPNYTYSWTPGTFLNDSTIAEPLSNPDRTITYRLLVTDTNNCTFLDSIEVVYTPDFEIPSGISPNGDGVNDTWEIDFLEEFPKAKVMVYNRWGELIYEQRNGYIKPWDGSYEGKALPIGTYYYIIDLNTDRFEPFTGPITIVK